MKSLQQHLADIRRIFHRAKSICSDQGIEEDQSSFHFTYQVTAFGLYPSYEAQLSQSSTYQRAHTAAVEELAAKRIELLDEKYALEDKVEGLLLEIDLKNETNRQLEHDISTKDQKISILEHEISNGSRLLLNKQKVTELENELALLYEVIDLKDDAIIHKATKNGHAIKIDPLLTPGASLEVGSGQVKALQMLLEKGANIEATNADGKTPLHTVVSNGLVELVKILLENGANTEAVDEEGWTPLHRAAFYGHVEIVQILLEKGANREIVGKGGGAPLQGAASLRPCRNSPDIARKRSQHGSCR